MLLAGFLITSTNHACRHQIKFRLFHHFLHLIAVYRPCINHSECQCICLHFSLGKTVCLCGAMSSVVNQFNALGCVFASHLCHSGQTHRFRHCSLAAMGAFEYPKTIPEMAIERKFMLHYLNSILLALFTRLGRLSINHVVSCSSSWVKSLLI